MTLFLSNIPKRVVVLTLLIFAVGLMGLSWPNLSYAKTVSVHSDRPVIELGDVMTLVVETDFQVGGTDLDLSLLTDQFEVLGSQRSNNIQIINGDFKSSTRWQIQLTPKQAGELMIPALTLDGVSSAPYPIRVQPLSVQTNGLEPFFLTASLSQTSAYVQQQVLYTLQFFYQGRFLDGGIRPPVFNDAQVTPMSDQTVYTKQINGQNYTVYEWVYALHPQKSGQLDITPPMFNGQIQLQGRQKQVQIFAKPLSLTVLPEPQSYAQNTQNSWLPASQITLTQQGWEPSKPLHVGEAFSATLTLNAQGLTANQLPNLTDLNSANPNNQVKIYSEPAVRSDQITAQGVVGQVQVKQTFIATQAGELTLPPQSLTWWNTQTNQLQTTTIPAKTLTILPAKTPNKPTTQQDLQVALPANSPVNSPVDSHINSPIKSVMDDPLASDLLNPVSRETVYFWQILSLIALTLWGVTLFAGWRMWRKLRWVKEGTKMDNDVAKNSTTETTNAQHDQNKTRNDWLALTPNEFYRRLRSTLHNDYKLTHWSDLALEPSTAELWQAIQPLESHLFNQTLLCADCQANIVRALNRLSKPLKSTHIAKTVQNQTKLKSLYGQK